MDRTACIIAAGEWGGKRALLKSRDRGYTPSVTLVREIIDGVEVAYMRDEVTGWCEGLNEYGIGVANSALAVKEDELHPNKIPQRKKEDGEKVLAALSKKTLKDSIKSLCAHLGGLEGHTFVSDPERAASVEYVTDHDCVVKYLDPDEMYVRTNHGRDTGNTGYNDPDNYISSVVRKERAYQSLKMTVGVADLAPDLVRANSDDRHDPNNLIRDTKKLSTTSQMVLNLTDLELCFYVIPGKMDYEGIEDNLPGDYQSKIKLKVYGYRNGGKELVELSPKTGLRKKKVDPVKLASRYLTASSAHAKSIALMKFLSSVARDAGVARHVYVVGGAVRNYILGVPIKDIDVVVDSVSMGQGRDSEWYAKKVVEVIPVPTSLVTNQYGVVILTVKGEWLLDGINMKGEVIEIANARKESYEGAGGKGKGYKPTDVSPATIEEDVFRREFTFNTLLWRMLDLANGPDKAEIIDFTGLGRQHLDEKLISTPVNPDKTFSDDPTRQLRILKFLLRYDLKISPDVVASVKRNAHKLKSMPWEAVGNILIGDILNSPKAMTGIKVMRSLGILDVIVEMVKENPPFAAFLTKQLANGNHSVELLLELADLGVAGRVLEFLTPPQRERFKMISTEMSGDEAKRFLGTLRKPPVDNLALIQEFNLQDRDRGSLVPIARELLLNDPSLAPHEVKLNDKVREFLRSKGSPNPVRVAQRFARLSSQP